MSEWAEATPCCAHCGRDCDGSIRASCGHVACSEKHKKKHEDQCQRPELNYNPLDHKNTV